jgi:tol-pal system protein YbgF
MSVRNSLLILPLVIALGGCTMLQPSEDPVLIKLTELEHRLATVERIVDNQSLAEMTQQLDALERRVDQMQGVAETLEHDAGSTADRQRQLYADLDSRIQDLESTLSARGSASVLEGGTLPPGQLPVPGGSDRDNYQVAFELLKEERYEMAATAFQQFLVAFPDSELADNAQYWLAESYYASDKFEQALTDFEVVINNYPRSRKVPDALLKMGYCNYSLRRWDAARVTLSRVQADYPETTAARLAGQYLTRMASEGI